MADRYQTRSYPTDVGTRPDPRMQTEGDPLAELARLIGQTDPFAASSRQPAAQAQRHPETTPAYHDEPEDEQFETASAPPPWMQRVAAQRAQQTEPEMHDDQPEAGFDHHQGHQQDDHQAQYHDPQAYAASGYPAPAYPPQQEQSYPGYDAYGHPQIQPAQEHLDPNRYDDALYGQADDAQHYQQHEQYDDEPYAYQQGYAEQQPAPKRRGGLLTVAAVLSLAVVGTGGAFAYRTFVGSPRSGQPPVIKADPGPNKIVPPSATAATDQGKTLDRLAGGQERLVPREEQPVNVEDASKAGGPRVVFPPLNQNSNPPTTASVSPANKPMVGNGAMQGDEPRKIRTLSVRGDQFDAAPAPRPAAARTTAPAAVNANASANAPMSLSPQAAAPAAPTRTAALNTAPQDIAPSSASGGYVVQISSQRSDADARASFKALQGKFPSVLGSRSPLIKKADLGDKGTYYRAMVGPFGSPEEAAQLCGSLKTAGGQCVVQRN